MMVRISVMTAAAGAALLLAGCGSSATPNVPPATGGGGAGGGGGSDLSGFSASVQKGKTATFKAVYTSTDSSGDAQTITFEQAPPKQLFKTVSGTHATLMLNTGSQTLSCEGDSAQGAPNCVDLGSNGSAALTGMLNFYNGSFVVTAMQGWQTMIGSHLAGVSLKFSDDTIAGQAVRCAMWTAAGQTATYCVTHDGVLAKASGSSGSGNENGFVLTSYSTSAPASDFAVPAGASVASVPSMPSTP
jgi:hypothetical protein